jgi:copper chaperone CopZ
MRDNRCRESILRALKEVAGVRSVHENLNRANATIVHESPCTAVHLLAAVTGAGYLAAVQ